MSLKQKTISNVKWSFIESLSLKAIGFILGIILARLLTPKDFGLLAVVNVFYLLVTLFIDGGLKEALIQKKDATDVHYSSVFWLNLGIGGFLYILLFIAAPYIQDFYQYENLAFFIRLQSIVLIIESFGIIQIVKATKELNLKKITKARIPASLLSFGVGIFMAYNGYGILSLIVQQLVSVALYTIFLVVSVKYRPKPIFNFKEVKSLYNFGLKILGISLISRFYVQGLNLIYAKFYTPQLLGLNSKSTSIQNSPIEIVNSTFMNGIYPTMVVLQNDTNKLRELFLININLLTYIMLIINGIFYFKAEDIIFVLLGNKWMGSVIYLKIIAIGSVFTPVTVQSQNVFKIRNFVGKFLKLELFNKLLTLTLIFFIISKFSFPFILSVILIINMFFSFVYLYLVSKNLEFSFIKNSSKMVFKLIIFVFIGLMLRLIFNHHLFVDNKIFSIFLFATSYSLIAIIPIYLFDKKSLMYLVNKLKK